MIQPKQMIHSEKDNLSSALFWLANWTKPKSSELFMAYEPL